MVNKQKQWQLYYLGFLDSMDDIDGIMGKKTAAATKAMQETFGITADGVFGNHTRNLSKEVIEAVQTALVSVVPGIVIDGLAGPATVDATKRYQQANGLHDTGLADSETREFVQNHASPDPQTETAEEPKTGTFWDEIEYFTRNELRCKCGGRYCNGFPAEPQEMTVRLADRARKHFGKPATNVSFLRCKTWNALQSGVANSQHMYGEAMDIRISGVSANDLYSFLRKQPEVRYTYKINNTNVHFDIPKGAR